MGRSRGGLTTKLHALVDAEGRQATIAPSEGQESDCAHAPGLIGRLEQGNVLLADKGYDSNALRARTAAAGAFANIQPKRDRKTCPAFSAFLYRYRNLVQQFVGKLKHARGIVTRYDQRAHTYLAAIKLFCVRIWLRDNESTA